MFGSNDAILMQKSNLMKLYFDLSMFGVLPFNVMIGKYN